MAEQPPDVAGQRLGLCDPPVRISTVRAMVRAGRRRLTGLALAATAGLLAPTLGAAQVQATKGYVAVSTGHNSELVKTASIERKAHKSRTVAFSLGPRELPDLRAGDLLEASGEVTLTTTCVDNSNRCIGSRYGYSPRLGARIVIAGGKRKTGGKRAVGIGRRVTVTCRQSRPHRNHHCPLVLDERRRFDRVRELPCRPDRCRLNLVIDAHHRRAGGGDLIVIGADRPGGDVDQDKGRLNAVVRRAGVPTTIKRKVGRNRISRKIPMGGSGSAGHQVSFSAKLPHLRRGDVLSVRAIQRTDIDHLPYSTFISARLIVSTSPKAAKPKGIARRAITYRGNLGAANGFNCTQGSSGYMTTCKTEKVAVGRVLRDVVNKRGRSKPLYVNLITRSFPKLASSRPGDAAVIKGGKVEVRRFVGGD